MIKVEILHMIYLSAAVVLYPRNSSLNRIIFIQDTAQDLY